MHPIDNVGDDVGVIVAFVDSSHNPITHSGQHAPGFVAAVSFALQINSGHPPAKLGGHCCMGKHREQHSPGGTALISPNAHVGFEHLTKEQSGKQNGTPNVSHAKSVHLGLPFSSQLHSLHPSLYPFGHVSHPTNNISIIG